MGMQIEIDWDTIDAVTAQCLKSHYHIVSDMITNPNRIVDLDYNLKLQNALSVVLDYFGIDVEQLEKTPGEVIKDEDGQNRV